MKKGCLLLTLGIIGAAVVVNIIFSIRGTFVAKPHEIAGPRERESKVEGKKTSGEPKAEKSEAPKKSPFRELYSIISDKPTVPSNGRWMFA